MLCQIVKEAVLNGKPLSEDANAKWQDAICFCVFFFANRITKIRIVIFMHEVSVAILHCAEYNFEKLKTYWGEPKSPEEALCWKLECGITKCIHVLLISETYHWNKINRSECWNIGAGKNSPVKLRKILAKLMNNSASVKIESERIVKLRTGIRDAVIYLWKIKEDENYLNSIALQNVHEYLESLLEI